MARISLALCFALAMPGIAHAYIGPGMGAGALAAVLGVLGSIFLVLFAVIYYPAKRVVQRLRGRAGAPQDSGDPGSRTR